MKGRIIVKPEVSRAQHSKDHNHDMSGIFQELVHFIIIDLFDLGGIWIWNIV